MKSSVSNPQLAIFKPVRLSKNLPFLNNFVNYFSGIVLVLFSIFGIFML